MHGRRTTWNWSDEEDSEEDTPPDDDALGIGAPLPRPRGPRRSPKGRQLRLPEEAKRHTFTPQQRLLMLDTWRRSGLPAQDFAALVGVSQAHARTNGSSCSSNRGRPG